VEMAAPMALIYKVLFSSISTFETPPNCDCLPAVASPTVRTSLTLLQSFLWGDIFLLSRRLALPLFFEAKAWREQVKPLQFFDMADHRSLVNAELARYGGIRRRAWSGCLIEVAFDRYIDRKPIHANVRQILVNDTVLNINVGAGGGVCRGALVHTKPFAGRCLLLCLM
jgi:hypothetical protein